MYHHVGSIRMPEQSVGSLLGSSSLLEMANNCKHNSNQWVTFTPLNACAGNCVHLEKMSQVIAHFRSYLAKRSVHKSRLDYQHKRYIIVYIIISSENPVKHLDKIRYLLFCQIIVLGLI